MRVGGREGRRNNIRCEDLEKIYSADCIGGRLHRYGQVSGLTDLRSYATIAFKMKGYRSFFYAYFYGAPKAAVASR